MKLNCICDFLWSRPGSSEVLFDLVWKNLLCDEGIHGSTKINEKNDGGMQ